MAVNRLFAIDPGNRLTAFVIVQIDPLKLESCCDNHPLRKQYKGKLPNDLVRKILRDKDNIDHVVIERIQSFGFKAGQTLFDTCEAIGRYTQIARDRGLGVDRIKRKSAVTAVTGQSRCNDKAVTDALKRDYGRCLEQSDVQPTYDEWQALGVAIAYIKGQRDVDARSPGEPLI